MVRSAGAAAEGERQETMTVLGWGWTAKPRRGVRIGDAFADGEQVNRLETTRTYVIVAKCTTKAMARDVAEMLNRKRRTRKSARRKR